MKIGLSFVDPMTFVLHRFAVSVAMMLPVFLLLRKRLPTDKRTLVSLVVLSLIFASVVITQALGLTQESSGVGAVLVYTQPLFVFCLAAPFLQEQITAVKVSGAIIGFAGVSVLFLDRIGSLALGSTLVLLLSAFLWAVSVLYFKKYLNNADPLMAHFFQLLVGTMSLFALTLATNGLIISTDVTYLCILLYSSAGALAVGNIIWLFLLKQEEATTLSGSTLIIPVVALLFGSRILGESLQLESLLGSSLTLVGVFLVNLKKSGPE